MILKKNISNLIGYNEVPFLGPASINHATNETLKSDFKLSPFYVCVECSIMHCTSARPVSISTCILSEASRLGNKHDSVPSLSFFTAHYQWRITEYRAYRSFHVKPHNIIIIIPFSFLRGSISWLPLSNTRQREHWKPNSRYPCLFPVLQSSSCFLLNHVIYKTQKYLPMFLLSYWIKSFDFVFREIRVRDRSDHSATREKKKYNAFKNFSCSDTRGQNGQ